MAAAAAAAAAEHGCLWVSDDAIGAAMDATKRLELVRAYLLGIKSSQSVSVRASYTPNSTTWICCGSVGQQDAHEYNR